MKKKIRKKKKKLTYALLRKLEEQGDQLARCYIEVAVLIKRLPAPQKKEAFDLVALTLLEKVYDSGE